MEMVTTPTTRFPRTVGAGGKLDETGTFCLFCGGGELAQLVRARLIDDPRDGVTNPGHCYNI